MSALSPFGERLRAWRKRRGLSQLDLATAAGTTSRYVSFVETGRSRPGRGVVVRLAEAMQLSLRDRNALLVAAGLRPMYSDKPLSDAAMQPVRRVLQLVLANHDPFPAWAVGPGLRFVGSNAAAERVFPGMTRLQPDALVDLWCNPPADAAAAVASRAKAVHDAIATLRHEMVHHPHPDLPALLRRAESHAVGLGPIPDVAYEPVMFPSMLVDGQRVKTVATVLRFDKPGDVTMAALRVELIFPADDACESVFRRLAAEAQSPP